MEDIATPTGQGVNLCSGTILKPSAEISTPGFQDAPDIEGARPEVSDKIQLIDKAPHPFKELTAQTQAKNDREKQRKRNSQKFPNAADYPYPSAIQHLRKTDRHTRNYFEIIPTRS